MWTEKGNEPNSQRLGELCFVSRKSALEPSSSQNKEPPPTMDLRGKFYEHYRKEAEEYDKDFLKKHDEDLNTTLIFVCCVNH
jgi:hypothetical protein